MSEDGLRSHFATCDAIVSWFIRKNPNRYRPYREDLKQEAYLACFTASLRYDRKLGPFMAFAGKRIRGALIDYLRRESVMRRSGNSYLFISIDADEYLRKTLAIPSKSLLENLMPLSLDPRRRAMFLRHFRDGETKTDIAMTFGITTGRVCQIIAEIRQRMIKGK